MKANSIIISTLIAIAISFNAISASARETIIISVHDYRPYYNSEGKGFMVDVYKAIYNRFGVGVKIEVLPIKRALFKLFNNQVDAFSPGHIFMSDDMKRNSEWDISFTIALSLFYYKPKLKKQIVFNSLDDIKGYKLAVLVNSSLIPLYKKHNLEYYEIQSPMQMLKMVKSGYVDFCVITLMTGMTFINQDFRDNADQFDYFVLKIVPCSLAFNKGNPKYKKMLSQFQEGLKAIKSDGTYIKILEEYWGKGNIPKAILFSDLAAFGVDHVDAGVFHQSSRNSWGRIISAQP